MTRLPFVLLGAILGACIALPQWLPAKPAPAPDPTAAIRAELQAFEQDICGRLERIERDTAKLRAVRP